VNQDTEQNEVDGMKKGVDSTGKVMHNEQESCAIAKMTARCALYK